jgi:hypothetical protein
VEAELAEIVKFEGETAAILPAIPTLAELEEFSSCPETAASSDCEGTLQLAISSAVESNINVKTCFIFIVFGII